jgi:hypothetical protein
MPRKKKTLENDQESVQSADEEGSARQLSQDAALNDVISATISQEELNDERLKELRRFLIPKLRSASYRWKFRSEAIKAARKSRGIYECAQCKAELKNGEFKADHIDPVVPLEGWDGLDWTTYINRLFVRPEGFQILCDTCHTIKSDFEVQMRKIHREQKKKSK